MNHYKISFFIIGAGRSGTTLLQSMLNAHPEITIPPESHFFRNYVVSEIRGRRNKEPIQDVADKLKEDEYLVRFEIDLDLLLKSFLQEGEQFSFRLLFLKILRSYAKKMGKRIVGEKDPTNSLFLKEIHTAYPDTFIFHIIRDPRDVVLSKAKTPWGKNQSFFSHLISTIDAFSNARENGLKYFSQKYIEILYENLIEHPKRELQKICQALDLEFHPNMLQFYKQSSQIVANDETQWKQNVFKPVIKSNTQKGIHELPKWKIIFIEGACHKAFNEHGYQRSGYGGTFLRLFCKVLVNIFLILRKIKRLVTKRLER